MYSNLQDLDNKDKNTGHSFQRGRGVGTENKMERYVFK